ncbi:MAG: choice-of-anchor Q domain-containing protein, partial [Limisphaerales bacterium]
PGYLRVVGDAVDIGAVEAGINPFVFNLADSGYGSLRYAINYATNNAIITFSPGLSGQTILVTNGQFNLNQNLVIDGSALPNSIRLNASHSSRLFNIPGGVAVTLNALLLTNGYTTNGDWGGAIANTGALNLNYCTLAGNAGDSTVAGGAIANFGSLALMGCALSGNAAGFGGAINNNATCILQNCTFATNSAFAGNGGAIDNAFSAILTVLHCTFTGNTASSLGGGIDNYLSTVLVTNSIVAGDGGTPGYGPDIFNWSGSTVTMGGSNIVQALDSDGIFNGATSIINDDPLLGPLANNGGPTQTMRPQTGSPAIDAGVTSASSGLAFDQRGPGYPRIAGPAVDIGAVEVGINPVVYTLADSGYGSLRFVTTYVTNNALVSFA